MSLLSLETRAVSETRTQVRIGGQSDERICHPIGVSSRREQPTDPIADDFRNFVDLSGNDGGSGGFCLQNRDTKRFKLRREHENVQTAQERGHFAPVSEKHNAIVDAEIAGHLSKRIRQWPVASQHHPELW